MIAAVYSAMVIEDPKKLPEKEEKNHDVTGHRLQQGTSSSYKPNEHPLLGDGRVL